MDSPPPSPLIHLTHYLNSLRCVHSQHLMLLFFFSYLLIHILIHINLLPLFTVIIPHSHKVILFRSDPPRDQLTFAFFSIASLGMCRKRTCVLRTRGDAIASIWSGEFESSISAAFPWRLYSAFPARSMLMISKNQWEPATTDQGVNRSDVYMSYKAWEINIIVMVEKLI